MELYTVSDGQGEIERDLIYEEAITLYGGDRDVKITEQ